MSETALLNRLCKLASQYSRCSTFIKHYRYSPAPVSPVSDLHGLYLCAFCEGLDSILRPYKEALLRVEQEVLADPHLTAAHVQSSLEQVHGCVLLDVLHRASDSGITSVKHAMQKLLAVCHRVLYRQLAAWMLHGIIIDKYNEFFIHQKPRSRSEEITGGVTEDEDPPVSGITGRQLAQIQRLSMTKGLDDTEPEGRLQFSLHSDMLPSYIPTRVADKVLFVGETVRMFQRENKSAKLAYRGSILSGKEDEFAKKIQQLGEEPQFDISQFEAVIDEIRSYVAERLWRIVVEEADLLAHLNQMKEFFLLGRGELFLAFIDHANRLLSVSPSSTTQYDANLSLQLSARSVLLQDDGLIQKYKITVATPPPRDHCDSSVAPPTGWQLLGLTCTVDWPLHILFTPSVLAKYNRLFKFLLYVKRVQLELQDLWAVQLKRKHKTQLELKQLPAKWWLRNHMSFLIDNLQYYLQVDVIESQHSILTDAIQSTQDFDAIRLALDNFLANLLSHSFLLMKPVTHCLHEILGLCHSFCQLMMQTGETNDAEKQLELDSITTNFQRQSGLLFKMLTGVHNLQTGTHLAKLLLRIDFNKYFTQAGGKLRS